MNYYYEAVACQGKFEANSDNIAILKFRKYGIVRIWRLNEDGTKTLILKRNNKK